jgi:acetyl esterase/lipase
MARRPWTRVAPGVVATSCLIGVVVGFGSQGRVGSSMIDRLGGRAPAAVHLVDQSDAADLIDPSTSRGAAVPSPVAAAVASEAPTPMPVLALDASDGASEAGAKSAEQRPPTAPTARPATLTDLAYDDASAQQRLDLYLPAAAGPSPVVVYLHGGGWVGGDKASPDDVALIAPLVEHGFAVVSANYRFATEAHFPAQLDDARAALAWVRANATRYGLDAARLGAFGVSAGAHLAVLLGIVEGPAVVRSVVDWSGPVDLVDVRADMSDRRCRGTYTDPDDPASFWAQLVGGPVGSMTAAAHATDPRTYLTAAASTSVALPRFLVVHGDRDCTVPVRQSERLVDALRAAAGPDAVTFDLVPGAGHAHEFPAAAQLPATTDFLTATTLA